MTDHIEKNEHIDSCTSIPVIEIPIISDARSKKSFLTVLKEFVPTANDLFSSNGNKEIGFFAILAWHHGIAKLAARQKVSAPPVLLSTISMLVSLSVIRGIRGKETTDKIVKYFDPSVDFLGTWMPLWLVPSLVLLPNALRKIEKSDHSMWLKLIITHFVLWYASTVGTAKLYQLIEGKPDTVPAVAIKISGDTSSDSTIESTPEGSSPTSPNDTTDTYSNQEDIVSSNDNQGAHTTDAASNTFAESPRVRADTADSSSSTDTEGKAEKFKKQLKLLRFWGAITACFYAAPLAGLINSKAPALGGSTITALIAGNMMPANIKKIFHPLILATAISAIATVISDRFMNVGVNGLENAFGKRNKSWVDSLYCFTSPTAPDIANVLASSCDSPFKMGDYFALVLGPACTALAFRIFSQSEKLQSKLPAIITASAVSAVASLLVSPLVGSLVGVPPELNAALAHRSISSALAVPSAKLTGASSELTVAAVLLTGIYGASGQWLLDRHNITDEIAAGVAVGTAAHSIGTASLLPSRPQAAAVASVALVSTGIVHAAVCALPGVPALLNRLGAKWA